MKSTPTAIGQRALRERVISEVVAEVGPRARDCLTNGSSQARGIHSDGAERRLDRARGAGRSAAQSSVTGEALAIGSSQSGSVENGDEDRAREDERKQEHEPGRLSGP
jgi:hypothetical protein